MVVDLPVHLVPLDFSAAVYSCMVQVVLSEMQSVSVRKIKEGRWNYFDFEVLSTQYEQCNRILAPVPKRSLPEFWFLQLEHEAAVLRPT